ncbi:hypothetical protein ABZP36_008204 [Zizania latifolia]
MKQQAASVLLQSDKVEGSKVIASFMSEQGLLYLGSVGLLGEYSRTTRKRLKLPLERPCCMHLNPACHFMQASGCSQRNLVSADSLQGYKPIVASGSWCF